MREFVESLKRLFTNKLIGEEKIHELLANKKISEKESNYILGKE